MNECYSDLTCTEKPAIKPVYSIQKPRETDVPV